MKTILYNIQTQQPYGPMRYGRYLVDGQPGPLPEEIIELDVVQAATPDYDPATETIEPQVSLDLDNKMYVEGWTFRPLTASELAAMNPVPQEVAAWRIRFVVAQAGLKQAIEDGINALPEPEKSLASEAYYNGTTIQRNSGLVNSLTEGLGITGEQLDDLFRQAANLPV